jgi:lactoylglutathione lyase
MTEFDHVGLSVADLEAATDFYGRAFDFEPEFRFELGRDDVRGSMLLHPSGMRLELFERPGAVAGIGGRGPIEALAVHGYGHFALRAEALEPAFERALEAGAEAVFEPRPSPEPGVRMAFLADPEGNLVELVERGS